MRAVVMRVKHASVTIDGRVNGAIGQGLLILLGVAPTDTPALCDKLAEKALGLRIFCDENGKMNRSLADALYERFLDDCRARGFEPRHGEFGADMQVESCNDGPVTIPLDTDDWM